MCKMASFVLTKDKVFWSKSSDSHEDIIKEFGLHADGVKGPNILRVEIVPPDDNYKLDTAKWVYRTDQDTLPPWADTKTDEKRVRSELEKWHNTKIFIDKKNVSITGINALLYNSSAVLWENSSAVLWENSSAVLRDNSSAVLWENSSAVLRDNSSAVLMENSSAVLRDNSSAVLRENSSAVLRDNSSAVLRDNSSAVLWENSSAVLRDNSSAVLRENSSAVLRENSSAVLRDNSRARKNGIFYISPEHEKQIKKKEVK